MYFTPRKQTRSSSVSINVKKVIRYTSFPNIYSNRFDSFHVRDQNAKFNQLCPILKIDQNTYKLMFLTPKKQPHSASLSYDRFDSFHVSDLNGKRNQHANSQNQPKYIKIDV